MTVQTFIEKARSVGYGTYYECDEAYFLDPEAWKAVGKVEGWGPGTRVELGGGFWTEDMWLKHMHRMIDHLAEGGTIESYLETL